MSGPGDEGEEQSNQQYDDAIATEVLCSLSEMASDAMQIGSEWMDVGDTE